MAAPCTVEPISRPVHRGAYWPAREPVAEPTCHRLARSSRMRLGSISCRGSPREPPPCADPARPLSSGGEFGWWGQDRAIQSSATPRGGDARRWAHLANSTRDEASPRPLGSERASLPRLRRRTGGPGERALGRASRLGHRVGPGRRTPGRHAQLRDGATRVGTPLGPELQPAGIRRACPAGDSRAASRMEHERPGRRAPQLKGRPHPDGDDSGCGRAGDAFCWATRPGTPQAGSSPGTPRGRGEPTRWRRGPVSRPSAATGRSLGPSQRRGAELPGFHVKRKGRADSPPGPFACSGISPRPPFPGRSSRRSAPGRPRWRTR